MSLPEKKIRQLIAMMNSVSKFTLPAVKPLMDCFDLAMDEQILDFLLEAGTGPYTIKELEAVYRRLWPSADVEMQWQPFLDEILEMSFLYPEQDGDKYVMATIFPGWIELSSSGVGPRDDKKKAILARFMDYWKLLKLLNIAPVRAWENYIRTTNKDTDVPGMTTYMSRGSREITLNTPLTSEQEILAAGDVYELLARHRDEIAVMNCMCRLHKDQCEQGLPLEGCVTLGSISRQLVEYGAARHLTFEEACRLMDDMEKHGCIHTTYHYGNSSDREEIAICNCCKDCCILYGSSRDGSISQVFVKSFYSPVMIDEGRCVGCNACGRYCPTDATWYDKVQKRLIFDYDRCIGCGQCVVQCKLDVRRMAPDARNVYVKTPKKRA